MKSNYQSQAEKGSSRSEVFKNATAAAVKAIAGRPEITVVFTPVAANQKLGSVSTGEVRLPLPPQKLTSENVARVRGAADAAAVRLKYHDPNVHARRMPLGTDAIGAYNAMEQARVEVVGARQFLGVSRNLGNAMELRLAAEGYHAAQSFAQLDRAEALKILVHGRCNALALGETGKHVREVLRSEFGTKLDRGLDDLAANVADQKRSADILRKLIETMGFEKDNVRERDREEDSGDDGEEAAAQDNAKQRTDAENDSPEQGQDSGDSSTSPQDSKSDGTEDQDSALDSQPAFASEAESDNAAMQARPRPGHNQGNRGRRYKAFTTRFDQVEDAANLCDAEELTRLRLQLDRQLDHLQGVVSRLANRLQRKLMAQQQRSWEFDLEEGLLDAGRLARVVTNPTHSLSFKREKETEFRDTVVSLLIDNSGSMRGRPITVAAVTADLLARTLERCGVKVEILGFTTSQWKGGQSRKLWTDSGKPAAPGRLNDLRHIVYKDADVPWRRARRNLGLMLREGVLKENIDGEALAWAHNRLAARGEQRRILMVISDGAPVDDSTLSVNPGNYLEQHLRDVISYIEGNSEVQLLAIGIGHDVTRYYRRAVTLMDADELGGAVMSQLTGLFDEDARDTRGRRVAPLVM
ncbi:MAG: cobaltochelatase subunit CobT [Rhodospirillaceae bacterium]|nr:cobaltochelatase subunit CobT [Rhodospirillaceae bacterium]